jgi:hypothetical protein
MKKELSDFNEKIDEFFTENSKENIEEIIKPIDEMKFEGPTLDEVFKDQARRERKLRSEWKKKLKGLINITGLFKHLDGNAYWEPEDIVDIELVDDKLSGYGAYQHARIVGDETRRLYMKTSQDEYQIRQIDHYYVWQRTGYMEDDYFGFLLFPLKNGRYFKVSYTC